MANEITAIEGRYDVDIGRVTWTLFMLFPITTPATVGGSNVVPTPANGPLPDNDDMLPPVVSAVITAGERTALNDGTSQYRVIEFVMEPGLTNPELIALARAKYAEMKTVVANEYDARYEFAGVRIDEV